MKLKKTTLLLAGALASYALLMPNSTEAARVVGYYENWCIYNTPATMGTGYAPYASAWNALAPHMDAFVYAFATFNLNISNGPTNYFPTNDWSIYLSDSNDTSNANNLIRAYGLKTPNSVNPNPTPNPNMDIMLSIGGWNFTQPQATVPGAGAYGTYGYYSYPFYSIMVADQGVTDYTNPTNRYGSGPSGAPGGSVIANGGSRDAFVRSCYAFCTGSVAAGQAFDGIDIDWEYPGRTDRGGAATDYQGFLTLLTALRTQFNTLLPVQKKISLATPSGADSTTGSYATTISWSAGTFSDGTPYPSSAALVSSFEAPYANLFEQQYFQWLVLLAYECDWLNVMTYDYYGPGFAAQNGSGQQLNSELAPLYAAGYNTSGICVDRTMTMYLNATIPATTNGGPGGVATPEFSISPTKLNMGIPAYGRGFNNVNLSTVVPGDVWTQTPEPTTPPGPIGLWGTAAQPYSKQIGYMNYYEIMDSAQGTGAHFQNIIQNPASQTTYGNSPPYGCFVSFDCAGGTLDNSKPAPNSVANKCQYIISRNLGGGMIWALDCDDVVNGFPVLNTLISNLKLSKGVPGVGANPFGPTTGGTN